MPVFVNEFTWRQSENMVIIRVPLKNVHPTKVDIFTSDEYIKAHYHHFLFEAFLLHKVWADKSKCTLQDDEALFELIKQEDITWDSLTKDISNQEKTKIKRKILEESQELATKICEEKVIRKNELNRYAVRQAMDVDSKMHKLMDQRKDQQREIAMKELEEWRNNKNKEMPTLLMGSKNSDPDTKNKLIYQTKENRENTQTNIGPYAETGEILDSNSDSESIPVSIKVKSEYIDKKKVELMDRILPEPRSISTLDVSFTPRVFPTPTRESQIEEEQTWLKNITEARKATGFLSEDLRPEEQDPQWCKDKGDDFFRNGNFLGAISAYTHGITLSDRLPSLYANRAATHFALGNFNRCLNDCSSALELLVPACEANRASRARCYARRAAALARLGLLSKAIDEMKAASRLMPHDANIKQDIYNMERAWEQNPDSD